MAKKKSTSLWVWAFLFVILGSFVAFVMFLDRQIVKSSLDDSRKLQESTSIEKKPTIDFYKVLPDRKVDIPIDEEDRAAIENPSLNKEAVDKSILQVGSFSSSGEADGLKAKLAFLGLEATVKRAVVNNQTWHRVQLGPFASEAKLSRAKNLLIENQIEYMQRSTP